MEGKKFSSSQRVVIYVRDLLSRYQPDAFRYFVAAAGPENQDSDFTWAEFVRRTNDELVAGWGNLVNRTATMVAKNFGEIPAAGELTADGPGPARPRRRGLRRRRRPDRPAPPEGGHRRGDARRGRGQQVRLRLRAVEAEGRRPARAARHGPARGRPVRGGPQHDPVAVPAVLGQRRRPGARRRRARSSRCRGCEEAEDLDGGAGYPILTGDYTGAARWERRPVVAGTPIAKPAPVFTKLDPAVVDEELARLRRPMTSFCADRPGRMTAMSAPMYLPEFFVKQDADDDGQPLRGQRGSARTATPGGLMAVAAAEADGVQGAGLLLRRRPAAPSRSSPSRRRQALDLGAGYDVRDAAGRRAAAAFRKDFGASLLRSTSTSAAPGLEATGQERNQVVGAVLRRFVDFPFSHHSVSDFGDRATRCQPDRNVARRGADVRCRDPRPPTAGEP